MMKNQVFLLLFILTIVGSFAGAVLKIMHAPGADILLAAALLGGYVFAVLALWEILPSSINKSEKLMWMVGFVFLNWITVILYLAVGRNRIMRTHQRNLSS
ncbi:MAG: PLD nuclease N-terminal domain-containing protein [Chitinophagaceae bacterium]|nr:PLD nuclease N-terminal domain-containing protein [Chitinophagaceae bacterium]